MRRTTELPIIFSGEMVRAILAGRKTQTRRVVKPVGNDEGFIIVEEGILRDGELWPYRSYDGDSWDDGNGCEVPLKCPYGVPGTRLWVRETHSFILANSRTDSEIVIYRADREVEGQVWRPSIFMPRELSRIDLIVKSARVERLQEISSNDVAAEGCVFAWGDRQTLGGDEERARWLLFSQLWDRINAKRGYAWASNPWVWVVEFRMVPPYKTPEAKGRGTE